MDSLLWRGNELFADFVLTDLEWVNTLVQKLATEFFGEAGE